MNARFNYFILFGLCLAFLSSSALGSNIDDPFGRINAMRTNPISGVRAPVPYHFQNLPSSATRVVSTDRQLRARQAFRFAGRGVSMNTPAVITYSRAVAVGALRGCISSGPACFGGAIVGTGLGLGFQYFLPANSYRGDFSTGLVAVSPSNDLDVAVGVANFLSENDLFVADGGRFFKPSSIISDVSPSSDNCLIVFANSSNSSTPCPASYGNNAGRVISGTGSTFASSLTFFFATAYPDSTFVKGLCTGWGGTSCSNTETITLSNSSGDFYSTRYTQYGADGYRLRYFTVNTAPVPSGTPFDSIVNSSITAEEVPLSTVLYSLDFSTYTPDSSDLAILGDRLLDARPVSITFDHFSPYTLPSTTEISYDAEGNTITTTITETVSPSVLNNATANPSIEVATNTNTVVSDSSGVISDTNTGTIVRPVPDTGVNPDTGQPYPSPPNADTSYDCWSFQFICDWFAWTQLMPDEPEFDFSSLTQVVDVSSEDYIIVGGVANCPSPIPLDLDVFGTHLVPYDSFCTLATTVKPFYLTIMALFSSLLIYRGAVS